MPNPSTLSLKNLPLGGYSGGDNQLPQTPSTPSTPGGLRGVNALSSRITAVLSASYADAEFREVLSILDERGVQNTAETRRRLRLDLQKEVIDSNGAIIADFGRVAEQLQKIKRVLDKLNNDYQGMKTQIESTHKETAPILAEASSLLARKSDIEEKQQLLRLFQEQFIMSEDEIALMTLTSEPVDDQFFAVLSRAKRISKESEILLGFESQTMGLELTEQTSKNLDLAFQKLYKWIQREFKSLNLENPQMSSSIRRGLRVLAERPSLFQNCLSFFAEARERILSDSFFVALTGSTTAGVEDTSVKPIELAAHDPLRYVGDMLAWMHSAAVSEREALEVLFVSDGEEIAKGLQVGRENEPWRLVADEEETEPVFDPVRALNELVDRDISGACRILRQRVEQVIRSNEETVLAYKLANLIGFYKFTFTRLLGVHSVLLESLGSLENEALRQFRYLMRDHIAAVQTDFRPGALDLGPPDFLEDALTQLEAIMKTYETSITSATDREAEFQAILDETFEPFMSGCENIAKGMKAPLDAIFLINCYLSAISTLRSFDFTQKRVERLREDVKKQSLHLVAHQYRFFRQESGLDDLIELLAPVDLSKEDVNKVRSLAILQPAELSKLSQILDDFLPSAFMDAIEKLRSLHDAKLARETTEEAANQFCNDFERVEAVLQFSDQTTAGKINRDQEDDSSGQNLRDFFPRTAGEIRVLLS